MMKRWCCAGHASLFALSSENAMVQFMSRGAPRVLENQVSHQFSLRVALALLTLHAALKKRLKV
jgi:hypothetical protein